MFLLTQINQTQHLLVSRL